MEINLNDHFKQISETLHSDATEVKIGKNTYPINSNSFKSKKQVYIENISFNIQDSNTGSEYAKLVKDNKQVTWCNRNGILALMIDGEIVRPIHSPIITLRQ